MLELIITDRLHRKIGVSKSLPRLVSMRTLSKREILIAKELGIRRYYLPSLDKAESAEFFKEFDKFWDQVIKPFDTDHVFWRNVVSSKMQEWERSAAYLALILFTIAQKAVNEPKSIVIVCSSLEEECVCEEWGKKMGWKVYKRPYLPVSCWYRRIFQEIWNLKDFLRMFAACLYRKWFSPKYEPESSSSNDKVLIASLFYDSCFNNGMYLDPFFGNLHKIIRQNGKSVTYLAEPLGNFRESAKKVRGCSDVSIIIPYSIIRWAELISLGLKVFIRRVRLPRTTFCGCDLSRLIMWNARRFDFFFNLHSEIYYIGMKNLCKTEHFERLIQLYEGNVFERGCIQAFENDNLSGLVIGYSHAVVYPLNLKIRLTGNEKSLRPEPDFLVCTGPENKRLMKLIGNRETALMHSGCSLRYIPTGNDKGRQQTAEPNILVALDGLRSCVTVLDWLFEHPEIFKDYKIKIRAHPNVPIKTLLAQCFHDLPDNFRLSNGNLKTDIENSRCVLYRQSSVGMQALMNGVPAIHLNIDAPLPCDPILNLKASKWSVRTYEELSIALEKRFYSRKESTRGNMRVAEKFVKSFFVAPDNKNVKSFFV